MHAGLNVLKPKLIETGVKPIGKVILGTVKGDLHDIGKNLVNGGYSITKTNYPSLARICLIGKNLNTENLRQKLLLG
jgi:cobalamin-dependent methionine synthase I